MSVKELMVPVRYYLHLANLLADDGIDILEQLKEVGVTNAALHEPDATIPFKKVDALVELLVEKTGRSGLGAELGPYLTVGSHSIVGFGMLSSANLADSLKFVARYFRLVMPSFKLMYKYKPGESVMHFTPVAAMGSRCLAFHIEAIGMAAFHEISDLSAGKSKAYEISMSIPKPTHANWYNRFTGVDFRFGAESTPGVRLLYKGDQATIPLTMADPNSLKMAESRCQAEVEKIAKVGEFSDWVAMTMREVGDRLPNATELAEMLSISPRTLNRYLQTEGTTFRTLHNEIQHEVAKERLSSGAMSVASVAYSLGFTDPSNFAHSFRRREGMSPKQYQSNLGQ